MFARVTRAAIRAALTGLVLVLPSAWLAPAEGPQALFCTALALAAGLYVFAEYASRSPSLIDFRDAPPFNRLRFACLAGNLVALSLLMLDRTDPSLATRLVRAVALRAADVLDFSFSPLNLLVLALPPDASTAELGLMRAAGALAMLIALPVIAAFGWEVATGRWPPADRTFNLWINLPLFEPAAGEDVVTRLNRSANIMLGLGIVAPFLLPALVRLASALLGSSVLTDPRLMVWTVTLWALFPTMLLMRAMALARIAGLIDSQRRRPHLAGEELHST